MCVHQLTSCSHISEKDHFTEQWHTHFKLHWIPLQSLTSHKKQNLKCFLHEEWLRAEVNSVPKTEQWPYSKPTDFWWLQGAGSNTQPWDRIYYLLAWNCGVFIFYSLNTKKNTVGRCQKKDNYFQKHFTENCASTYGNFLVVSINLTSESMTSGRGCDCCSSCYRGCAVQ